MAVFMARYDARLALVLIACLALAGIGVPLLVQTLSRRAGRDLVRLRADLNTALIDGVQGLADLLAYGADQRQRDRVQILSRTLQRQQARLAAVGALSTALLSLITSAAAILTLVITIPLVRSGDLDGVWLAVLVLAAMASFEAVQPLPAAFQHLSANLAAARRLFELVDVPKTDSPQRTQSTQRKAEEGQAEIAISVRNLTFRYGPDEPLALEDVSFDLPAGRMLAVVGASGAGKSTLVNLLLRFWDADQGEIRLGGRDIRDLPPDVVRAQIGVVGQQTYLFNATIRDNLRLARPDARDEDLIRAAQEAQLHDFISRACAGLRYVDRGAGTPAERRRASAVGHRPRPAERRPDPHTGRSDRQPRYRDRAGAAAVHPYRAGRADDPADHPPAGRTRRGG